MQKKQKGKKDNPRLKKRVKPKKAKAKLQMPKQKQERHTLSKDGLPDDWMDMPIQIVRNGDNPNFQFFNQPKIE